VNRHFLAKRIKYLNFQNIKTTRSISAKFCTIIRNTEYSMWVI